MNKTRWLAMFLIASWTLNVALLVAYYMKTDYPPGAFREFQRHQPMAHKHLNGIPRDMKRTFRADVEPLHQELARLVGDISTVFSAEELDTVLLGELNDSLNAVRGEIQHNLMMHLCRLHEVLPPEARDRLSRRMCRDIAGHMPGVPDMHVKHGKRGVRQGRQCFVPDSIEK